MDVEYNLRLVQENVRPAMLIQPADYKEATGNDPRTKSILDSIRRWSFLVTEGDLHNLTLTVAVVAYLNLRYY